MRRFCLLVIFVFVTSEMPLHGRSLYLKNGERAGEGSVGWSVGPSSHGTEVSVGASLDGRTDVGLTIARYTYTFDDRSKSTFDESPFVRFFLVKEQNNGAPVSLAVSGQIFLDDYGTEDSGRYVQLGKAVYKQLKLSERLSLQPFIGFGFVAESYSFGGGPAERAQYLTRDLGLHFTTATDRPWFVRMTLGEQSFTRETYRGARVSVVRRL